MNPKKVLYFLEILLILAIYAYIRDLFLIKTEAVRKVYFDSFDVAEYVVDDNSYILEIPHANLLESGDSVAIGYYKNNPQKSILLTSKTSIWFPLVILISILATKKYISSSKKHCATLQKIGQKIEVEYEETSIYSDSYITQYIMKFKYVNPETNQVSYFTDHSFTAFNPDKLIKEKGLTKFTAYINPKMPDNYHIITDPLYENSIFLKERIFPRR